MAYENITLRKQNVTMIDGYFYVFDEDQDAVLVKTDDGTQAYSYPLSTSLTNEVVSLEYDGRNFWTMENPGSDTIIIRRWYINNYAMELRYTYTLTQAATGIKWDSQAFTIEHYHVEFGGNESAGQTNLSVDTDGKFDLNDKLNFSGSGVLSGMIVVLGPNSSGEMEERVVSSAGADYVNVTAGTTYAYETGDPITFYRRIWVFNNYNGTTAGGALYRCNPYVSVSPSFAVLGSATDTYEDINACTFFDLSTSPAFSDDKNTIAYVKATNMIFLDPDDLTTAFGSMVMDNLEDDQATTIPIYDFTVEGTNVYRLQLKATYYGTTYTFDDSTYNYQLSTLNPFVTSISLRAEPAILPADEVSQSAITAVVRDQFNRLMNGKYVYFTEDDSVGYITVSPVVTSNGVASTYYNAGNSAREVKITATAQQS